MIRYKVFFGRGQEYQLHHFELISIVNIYLFGILIHSVTIRGIEWEQIRYLYGEENLYYFDSEKNRMYREINKKRIYND